MHPLVILWVEAAGGVMGAPGLCMVVAVWMMPLAWVGVVIGIMTVGWRMKVMCGWSRRTSGRWGNSAIWVCAVDRCARGGLESASVTTGVAGGGVVGGVVLAVVVASGALLQGGAVGLVPALALALSVTVASVLALVLAAAAVFAWVREPVVVLAAVLGVVLALALV